ncbi:MAG: cation diffusion facilitator family transporter [bacterium]|nr:cation diffusion facilitator family transporter [bacterium]
MKKELNTIRMQKLLVGVSVLLFIIKVVAWILTSSVAILTDAMESTVNVVAGFIGLYSIILSSKPKDKEHPYGHGKAEFLSSAIEGVLISVAGLIIIYEALNNLIHPHQIKKLDYGIVLIAITAVVNYIVGQICVNKGKKENSPILIASGSHLKSDTYSTLGLLLGILLIIITGKEWIDSAAALLFAFIIIFTGYKIIRRSIAGIMDETDNEIIAVIIKVLNEHREVEWVDIHNMRVINYAGFYHIDCHLTVPFYINVNEAHQILDRLTNLLTKHFKERVEFFVHIDGCMPHQCNICDVKNCSKRNAAFLQQIPWTNENILSNNKHSLNQ